MFTFGHCCWLSRGGAPLVRTTWATEVALSGVTSLSSPGPLSRSGHELGRAATLGFSSSRDPPPGAHAGARSPRARRMSSRTPRRRKGRPWHDTAPPAAKIGSTTHSMTRWLHATAPRGFGWRSTGGSHRPRPSFVVELSLPLSRLARLQPPLLGRRSRQARPPLTTSLRSLTARTLPPLSVWVASAGHPLPRQRC